MRFTLACIWLLVGGNVLAGGVTLARDGRSAYVISLPANATPAMRYGAAELQASLRAMSGAELLVRSGGAAPARAVEIQTDPSMPEETLRIRTVGQRIVISGGGKRGAMYGCIALLEDVLGCRWYTSRVSYIPHRATIWIPPTDLHEQPGFEYREPYYFEALDRDWAVHNRTNGNFQHLDDSVGGHMVYYPFVHTFSSLVPPEKYFATHPEYFSMVGGKRVPDKQLCLTNPDVLRIAIAQVKEWIKANPDAKIISVSQNDTHGPCEDPGCKAVEAEEGSQSGVLLRFVNAVADAVGEEYPNVLIDMLAYQWSEKPPLHVRPHRNVRIRLAPIGACFGHPLDGCAENAAPFANLKAWSNITGQLYVWHYATNFANYLQPLPDLDEIAGDIPLFARYHVAGLFYEGDYAPGGGGEMAELKSYLMAKLMWNPKADAKAITADFIKHVYGPAAPYISQWLKVEHAPVVSGAVHAHIYDPPSAPYLSDATLAEGHRLFDKAEQAAANDPRALDEVRRARLALQYVERTRARGAERNALGNVIFDDILKYGITQAREGEPVEQYVQRIRDEVRWGLTYFGSHIKGAEPLTAPNVSSQR